MNNQEPLPVALRSVDLLSKPVKPSDSFHPLYGHLVQTNQCNLSTLHPSDRYLKLPLTIVSFRIETNSVLMHYSCVY